jgi:DNA-binding NarL/FixJ family response regulator
VVDRSQVAVVIVEDDDGFRRRFQQIFAQQPQRYRVAGVAASAARGIEAVRGHDLDLLVVDLGLPDGDGIAVIREARSLHADCDIIVVTVFGDEEHVVSAIEAGASGYLLKDCNTEEFLAAVDDLLAGGSPVSPMVARVVLNRLRRVPDASPEPPPQPETSALTERELEILTLVAKGFSFADICRLLTISTNTVKTHVNRIYRKLAVHSRGQAVHEAAQLGLIVL